MKIDQTTVVGAAILFIVTAMFTSFITITTKPSFCIKDDKKVNKLKAVSLSVTISLIFTSIISYISIKADTKNVNIH